MQMAEGGGENEGNKKAKELEWFDFLLLFILPFFILTKECKKI